jgi:methylenetetrahydrofolate dehydrogenase (NADP+)/methenyltetrahydrofolate cyclohydrolase
MKTNETSQKAALILDGKTLAKQIKSELKQCLDEAKAQNKRLPGLAIILVGSDPASEIYVKNKLVDGSKIGVNTQLYKFANDCKQEEILQKIDQLNTDKSVDGILVQLPLPQHLNTFEIVNRVNYQKDVDGLTTTNIGLLASGHDGLKPCTPLGIMRLLKHYEISLAGKNALVIGRSNLVGKPISLMLLKENATVTISHSKSKNLQHLARQADIIIAAAGKPEMVKEDWIKPGACVIDVGIHRISSDNQSKTIVGDVDFSKVSRVAGSITPVPGGIGPMTVSMLLSNVYSAYKNNL